MAVVPAEGPGLYIHIPFCERKCVYCDFYSIEKLEQTNSFLVALEKEIDLVADQYHPDETFATVFLGGGTPSLLTPNQLEHLLTQLQRRFKISDTAEITMECNPGTVDRDKLAAYRTLGVNRISFGVQSFIQDELDFLGRIHNADQARQAVAAARAAGFDNVSVDLIFALPMHTRERWEYSLREAIALQPEHISAYSLIYEEGTPLYAQKEKGLVIPMDEELDAELYLFTVDLLSQFGYCQYEVSNYARRRDEGLGIRGEEKIFSSNPSALSPHPFVERDLHVSQHNLNYWRRGRYLSFGPSAHSFWNGDRWWNVSSLTSYLESLDRGVVPVAGSEHLTDDQALTEAVSLGLRSDGIRLRQVTDLFKFDFLMRYDTQLAELVDAGFLIVDSKTVRCTPKGYLACDALTLKLLN